MKKQTLHLPWALNDINELLSPAPLRLEMGIERDEVGHLTVAVRTDLHGCKGKMLEWWFTFFETSQHIRWWHPHDHVAHNGWDDKWIKGKSYIGASIKAVESLGDIPSVGAQLKFHDAKDFFDNTLLEEAYKTGALSGAVCATIGFGSDVKIDENGDPTDGKMVHLTRDTDWGCVLRSRFYLGHSLENPAVELSDEIAFGLLQHCYNEFTYLSRFLPSLYYGEHANGEKGALPW